MESSVKEPLAPLEESPVISERVDNDKFIFHESATEIFHIYQKIIDESNSDVNDDKYEINNVVSVIGERGSGKTSFLLSIMNSLRKKQLIEGFGSSNEVFVIDSLIEPRFFDEKNSIVKLIIAKLFSIYKKDYGKNPNISSEDLNSCFQELSSLMDYMYSTTSDGSMEGLDQLSDYFEIKEKLTELFEGFLRFENCINENGNFKTIAFFIDDLDLDSKNAYRMISDISKYLKVKCLILTLAYDQTTMEDLICFNKIVETAYPFLQDPYFVHSRFLDNLRSLSFSLNKCKANSTQFLCKFIPLDYQVNLKAKMNYNDSILYIINVLLEKPEKSFENCKKLYPDVISLFNNATNLRIENQAFNLIYDFYIDQKLSPFDEQGKYKNSSDCQPVFEKAISKLFNLDIGETYFTQFEISNSMFSVGNKKDSFLVQCHLILGYFKQKLTNPNLCFGEYLNSIGILFPASENIIFALKKVKNPTATIAPKPSIQEIDLTKSNPDYDIEPLAFFELISKICSLKNNKQMKGYLANQYLGIIRTYYPNCVQNSKAFPFISNLNDADVRYLIQKHKVPQAGSKKGKSTSKRNTKPYF